jgi:hypothetical protein
MKYQDVAARPRGHFIRECHGVHQAMMLAGEDHIVVDLWDVDQRTADAFLVADNRLGELSHPDVDRRRDLLRDLELDGEDFAAIGFLPAEVEKLFADDPGSIAVREIQTTEIIDTFWITVRGPMPQQAFALRRLRELLAELPGVEVELGTIAGS